MMINTPPIFFAFVSPTNVLIVAQSRDVNKTQVRLRPGLNDYLETSKDNYKERVCRDHR